MKDHWNQLYASRPVPQLGWYEAAPEPSLRLLDRCTLAPDDPLLDVGAGASTLIDAWLERGFRNVIAADISQVALAKLKERLGPAAARVHWLVDDVTGPAELHTLRKVALWHDRALLHFMLQETQRQAYWNCLLQVLRPGGYVILAAFAKHGAQRCSGLDLLNYDVEMLGEFLGPAFHLIDSFDYLYHMPSGDPRPFTYACFQRGRTV